MNLYLHFSTRRYSKTHSRLPSDRHLLFFPSYDKFKCILQASNKEKTVRKENISNFRLDTIPKLLLMRIKDSGDKKLITLSTPLDTRAKILHFCYFIVLFVLGTYIVRLVLEDFDKIIALVVCGSFGLLSYIGAYRFANRAVTTEQVLIARDSLVLIRKGILNSTEQVFDTQKISGFRHLAQTPITRHPLDGNTYDYLGFQTGQQLINNMHGDNQLAFDYDGKTIKFGNNIPSWDFEELQSILLVVTEKDLTVVKKESNLFYE